MPPNESSNNQSTGATSPTNQPSAEIEELIKEGIHGIRQIFKKNGEDLGSEEEAAIIRDDPPPPWPELPWFALYCSICKDLIDFTLIELTGVGYVVVLILGWILWVFLFFWFLGKMNGTWWRSLLIKRFWVWMVGVFVLESIPFLKIIPANTILVLLAHYKEKKVVRLIMLAMDLWHKYEIPLREGGEPQPPTGATPHTNKQSTPNKTVRRRSRTGSTPKTPEENPVTASQREHFADPSQPVAQGATPNTQVARDKNRPVDIAAHNSRVAQKKNDDADVNEYNLRVMRGENTRGFAESERSFSSNEANLLDVLDKNPTVPFPGAGSPNFGRGTRQPVDALDLNTRRRNASLEQADTTPKGATPRPVNDDVS